SIYWKKCTSKRLLLLSYAESGESREIVVVVGPKNVGKSTLVRSLITMLNGSPVYLLDADVGQSECTPSGCVSLRKINCPLFDASITSQECEFSHCYFFGSVTPETDSNLYIDLVLDLIKFFKTNSESKSVMVINTCGWVEAHFYFFSVLPKLPFVISSSARRDLLTASYFAKNLLLKTVWGLPDVSPRAVFFKSLYIYIHPLLGPLPDTQIFAALNCTLVALCVLPTDGKEEMPSLIDEESVKLLCIGFGFIRAVDIERGLMYVITPVCQESLRDVNVFARGINIGLPSYFLTQQHCHDPPYVVSVKRSSMESDMYKGLKLAPTTYKKMRK
uniref:CLP1_P domain-containing protein n=1 Tax=Syphacia muris TaxID=451379 RepID=A0A0N5ADL9_9BILA